jgi:hypothetical protein
MQIYAGSLTRSMWISKALASFLTLFALWWVLLIIFNRFRRAQRFLAA